MTRKKQTVLLVRLWVDVKRFEESTTLPSLLSAMKNFDLPGGEKTFFWRGLARAWSQGESYSLLCPFRLVGQIHNWANGMPAKRVFL